MKEILLCFCSFCLFHVANCQDNDLKVIASAGSTMETGNITLNWTLGELVVDFLDANAGISQGFHQPSYQLVSIKSIPEEIGLVAVLPNPISDELSIDITFENTLSGKIELFDINGKLLWYKPFEGNVIFEKYSTDHLLSGTYLLAVSILNTSFVSTYQLLKTN